MSIYDYRHYQDKPVLETERLLIRPIALEDASDLKEWLGLPEIYRYWGSPAKEGELNPEAGLMWEQEHREEMEQSLDIHLGIVWKENGKMVGDVWGVNVEDARMAKVAYRISPQYWNRGIATEALQALVDFYFTKTELQRLWTDVDTENIASARVLEKCGFLREGCIRQGKMVSVFCDYCIYGILRDDYLKTDLR